MYLPVMPICQPCLYHFKHDLFLYLVYSYVKRPLLVEREKRLFCVRSVVMGIFAIWPDVVKVTLVLKKNETRYIPGSTTLKQQRHHVCLS